MTKNLVCAVTGHRIRTFFAHQAAIPDIIEKTGELIKEVISILYSKGVRTFLTGGACGIDLWFAEEVMLFKKTHPDCKSVMCIPFECQDRFWPEETRKEYRYAKEHADCVIYVDHDPPSTYKFHKRNQYMVDHADVLIGFKFESVLTGGTQSCLNYGEKKHVVVMTVDPVQPQKGLLYLERIKLFENIKKIPLPVKDNVAIEN